MRQYTVTKRFYCEPIDRYVPIGAEIFRSDVTGKLLITNSPDSSNKHNTLIDKYEYTNSNIIGWFDELISSSALGDLFEFTSTIDESIAGGSGSVDANRIWFKP